jgi:hypothetical protein
MTLNRNLGSRVRTAAGLTAALVAVAACNEAKIPDYNALTSFPKSVAAVQNGFTGVFNGPRSDIGFYTLALEGFARNGAYYTPSEERFVTQLTGKVTLDNDNFGAGVWTTEFNAVKTADSIEALVTALTPADIPAANANALLGAAEAFKAYDYMLVAESHDTNGVVLNDVGKSTPSAPILCNQDVWAQIVQMLDSAIAYENAAGPGVTFGTGASAITLPPSYGSALGTSDGWLAFAHVLRGKANIEWAYAAARTPPAGSFNAPGTPGPNTLKQAIADIEDSSGSFYSASLSPTNAVPSPTTDPGVYHDYSTASGDQQNGLAGNASATYILLGALNSVDTLETAWVAKFADGGAPPTALPGGTAASGWTFTGPDAYGPSSPVPIFRNLELQFWIAAAQIGLGQTANAVATIQNVRTAVGGVGAAPVGPTVEDAQLFIIDEARANLAFDGTGDTMLLIRFFGLVPDLLTTWAPNDFETSMENIPLPENQARGGNIAHAACTTTPPS